MTLGFENRKKLAFLWVLLLALGFVFYRNVLAPGDGGAVSVAAPSRPAQAAKPAPTPTAPSAAAPRPTSARRSSEFRPVFKSKRPEDRVDPSTLDPRLHLELLARLQEISAESAGRNLFQFGAPPPPPQPKVSARLPREPEPIIQPKPVTANIPALPPPPPPIPFKYYGLSTTRGDGKKTAFFLEGETIFIVSEGDVMKKRYKVVRIGATSVVVEDTELKRQQTLQIEAEV